LHIAFGLYWIKATCNRFSWPHRKKIHMDTTMLFHMIKPALFLTDAERAHRATISLLSAMPSAGPRDPDPVLAVQLAGLHFPNPIGVAPGFDKDAEAAHAMPRLGFGYTEIGTITPLPQAGNPKPRLFRLVEDKAVINRLGFNNAGQDAAHARLKKLREQGHPGIIGVNIGANKDSADRIADYAKGAAKMAAVADYLTVNISSPNTPGLRALQDEGALTALLDAVQDALPTGGPPIFLKLAPDLERADIDAIARLTIGKVAALIISNTTISRPALASAHRDEAGGLSGAPLRDLALAKLREFRSATGGAMPLIAVGGISSATDAYARIKAGASLIQLYSALVYEGPGLALRIANGLRALLAADGFRTMAEAIDADNR
jgi:dihydroorotate dehydrogenase